MRGDKKEFKDIVEKQTKMILMFIVPCFIILFNFSTEIISILFVRGNYTQDNAVIAGEILKGCNHICCNGCNNFFNNRNFIVAYYFNWKNWNKSIYI